MAKGTQGIGWGGVAILVWLIAVPGRIGAG